MPLYRPSELQYYLDKWNTGAKKSLSQNFLIDGNIIKKIASYVPASKKDLIFEIGPGPGALTEELLKKGCLYMGVEKDELFFKHLNDYFKSENNFFLFNDDVLDFPIIEHLNKHPHEKLHIAGNLPYSITSPILRRLSKLQKSISSITIMVQDEVGRRICANPKSKDYGLLTLGVQFYFNAEYAFKVSPKCFLPAPKVNSAVIHLTPKETFEIDEEPFFQFLKKAFNVRRKSLRASLKEYGAENVVAALKAMNKAELSRPEELSLKEWHQFYTLMNPQ